MSESDRLDVLKKQVYEANMWLVEYGLVISTFGNVSGIDRESGTVVIKPSGVSYDDLSPENMVCVDLQNRIIGGTYAPSSDTRTHVMLYRNFADIGGVVHTHSKWATAWAQAHAPLPCLGTTHADVFHGTVPCTALITDEQIARDYEEETAVQILETFKDLDYRSMPAVLVASHGPFSWGEDPGKAVYNSLILEYVAEMNTVSFQVNPRVKEIKRTLLDKHYLRKHGKNAYYGQRNAGRGSNR